MRDELARDRWTVIHGVVRLGEQSDLTLVVVPAPALRQLRQTPAVADVFLDDIELVAGCDTELAEFCLAFERIQSAGGSRYQLAFFLQR